MMNRFIDHLQVVITNNYYAIADYRTTNHSTLKSSQSISTTLYLVIALHYGYSSAVSSLEFPGTNGDSLDSFACWLTLHS
jgi:hypothetical protein